MRLTSGSSLRRRHNVVDPDGPAGRTALAATAANPELGPVEICRLTSKDT